ncbi:MAG: hypothetical protein GX881_08200 [Firmicutes bacterium]|nr:hypothetical protein [Bacillota bacterium]
MSMTRRRFHCYVDSEEKLPVCNLELDPRVVELFVRNGIIEVEEERICMVEVLRINKIMRLKKHFGVNLAGAAIIVELLERLENMQSELERLRKGR